MSNYSGKLQQLLSLLTCVLLVIAVSIRRDGKVVGRELKQQQADSTKIETLVVLEEGSVRLNTTELGKDIIGYGGTVPLEITLENGKVKSVKALENSETPDFFKEASSLLTKWNGRTVEESGCRVRCNILIKGYHWQRATWSSVCCKESCTEYNMGEDGLLKQGNSRTDSSTFGCHRTALCQG